MRRSPLCERPFRAGPAGSLEPLREKLYDVMWEKVGIMRDARRRCSRRAAELHAIDTALDALRARRRATRDFNLTWHDWLNLKSLVAVSRAIALAARARRESRGAHFRTDFPESGSARAVGVHQHQGLHRHHEASDIHPRVARARRLLRHVA